METQNCLQCQKPKAQLSCGLCQQSVCKNCAVFLEDEKLAFWDNKPDHLKHNVYCSYCYEAQVHADVENYEDCVEKAKDIFIYFSDQGKETRMIRRKDEPYVVKDGNDRDETLMKLAFLAVRSGHNALVDVELTSKKVRVGGYQTLSWSGTGLPVQVDAAKENRKLSQIKTIYA